VYRVGGRQRKEFAATFAEARTIKLAPDAEAREAGPQLACSDIVQLGHLDWCLGYGGGD
jgi:hypothetical protein